MKKLLLIATFLIGCCSVFGQMGGCIRVPIHGGEWYAEYCCNGLSGCDFTGQCYSAASGGQSWPCFAPPDPFSEEIPQIAQLNPDKSVSITIKEESNTLISFTAITNLTDYCAPWDCNGNGCIRTCVTACNGYTTQYKPTPQSPDPVELCK